MARNGEASSNPHRRPVARHAGVPTRILLADDHASYREHLRELLDEVPDLQVVAEAQDGAEAIQRVQECSPDVVLMDVRMPGVGGVAATRQIVACFPDARVIALTLHHEREFVDAMFEAGASGYALKDAPFAELLEALRCVAAGGTWSSPALA